MKQTTNNGQATAQKANIYDTVETLISIEFEHDGRMTADEAREYVRGRVIGYTDHTGTIDEGTHILDVQDLGEPEPHDERKTFDEAARDIVEDFYNNSEDTDTIARTIAESISRAVTAYYGKGSTAKYLLDTISYHVQGFCNPALNDSDNGE